MKFMYVKRLLTFYTSYDPYVDQRSNEVTSGFQVIKLLEFLSPELNIVQFSNLNWNNAFCLYTCVFFSLGIEGH